MRPSKTPAGRDEATAVAEPHSKVKPDSRVEPYSEVKPDNKRLADAIERELRSASGTDPQRTARLHFELGMLKEDTLGQPQEAVEHYRRAWQLRPDHVPSIRGARRVLVALGRPAEAVPYLDAELPYCREPAQRARLLYEKGQLLERRMRQPEKALEAYEQGLQLDPQSLDLLRAAARLQRAGGHLTALDRTLERMASAVQNDSPYCAVLVAERGRLFESLSQKSRVRRGTASAAERTDSAAERTDSTAERTDSTAERTDSTAERTDSAAEGADRTAERRHSTADNATRATELYLSALKLDPTVPGALEAIGRLSQEQGQWQLLLQSLEQQAERSQDPEVRGAAQTRIAEVRVDKLGELEGGVVALQSAASQLPEDRLLLSRLASLFAAAGRPAEQAQALEKLWSLSARDADRLSLAHSIAELCHRQLDDQTRAEHFYRAALDIDSGHRPTLQALSTLYERMGNARGQLEVLQKELEAEAEPLARAVLHVRMGALHETRLDNPAAAVEQYRRALCIAPDDEAALRALDSLLPALGRFDQLAQVYEQSVDHAPNSSQAVVYLFRLGALYEDRLGEPAGALHAYERILAIEPGHLGALHALQRAAGRSGQYERLVRALEQEAETLEPSERWAALLYRAAQVYAWHLDDLPRAIERLRQVVNFQRGHRTALDLLGRLYRREQRWEDLLLLLEGEQGLASDTAKRAGILCEMAEVYETQLGQVREAIAHYRRALAVDPLHNPSLDALTRLLRAGGKWNELVQVLASRLSSVSDRREQAYLAVELGELYEQQLEDRDKALESFNRALEAVPGFRAAFEARTRLLAATGSHRQLAEALEHEAAHTGEPRLAIDALMRAAALRAEQLDDPRSAAALYSEVLERAPDHLGALTALENICIGLRDDDALGRVYARQAQVIGNTEAKIAALRDLARTRGGLERMDGEIEQVYRSLLQLAPRDPEALGALAGAAAQAEDTKTLVRHKAALAEVAEDRGVAASHHLAVARALETGGAEQAFAAYRVALSLDPESLNASRGMTRMALELGDPEALAEAARREAATTRELKVAVELLLHAATVRQSKGEWQAAAEHARQALDHMPEDERAAALLAALMLESGEVQKLAEQLSRAADRARTAARKAALYAEVAALRADRLSDVEGAISAAERALTASPKEASTLRRLAGLREQAGQWARAVESYEALKRNSRDPELQDEARLHIARIAAERLEDFALAQRNLQAVVARNPDNRDALKLQGRIYAREGKSQEALLTARRLVQSAEQPDERAAALVDLAHAEQLCGRGEAAERALCEAVALEGPDGPAARAYRAQIGKWTSWEGYATALERRLQAAGTEEAGANTARELAQVQIRSLGQVQEGLSTLEAATRLWPDDGDLWLAFAEQLVAVGRQDEAVGIYRAQVAQQPARADIWRGLSAAHQGAGRHEEALSSAVPLLLLDAARGEELALLRTREPRPAGAGPGVIDDAFIRQLEVDGALRSPAAALAQALAGAFGKLYPPDLPRYDVTRRNRIAPNSRNPVRAVADRVARILVLESFDLYVHDGQEPDVTIELSEPPALMVPRAVASAAEPVLVFALARRLFTLAHELAAVDAMPPGELAILLASAVRRKHPGFGAGLATEQEFEQAVQAVAKAVPWRGRKRIDSAIARVAESRLDLLAWVAQVQQTASRAALLLSDDLLGSMQFVEAATGVPALQQPLGSDLLHFWASEVAVEYRERR